MPKVNKVALWLAILCPTGLAEVYKTVDEYGNVRYSDTPSEQSEIVELRKINLQPPLTPPRSPPKANQNRQQGKKGEAQKQAAAQSAPLAGEATPMPAAEPRSEPRGLASTTTALTPQPPRAKDTGESIYGLRIAIPKTGSEHSNVASPITLVLLTSKFLSQGERFEATVNGRPSGEPSRANNLSVTLPENPGDSVLLGARIINERGQVLERATAVEVHTRQKNALK